MRGRQDPGRHGKAENQAGGIPVVFQRAGSTSAEGSPCNDGLDTIHELSIGIADEEHARSQFLRTVAQEIKSGGEQFSRTLLRMSAKPRIFSILTIPEDVEECRALDPFPNLVQFVKRRRVQETMVKMSEFVGNDGSAHFRRLEHVEVAAGEEEGLSP